MLGTRGSCVPQLGISCCALAACLIQLNISCTHQPVHRRYHHTWHCLVPIPCDFCLHLAKNCHLRSSLVDCGYRKRRHEPGDRVCAQNKVTKRVDVNVSECLILPQRGYKSEVALQKVGDHSWAQRTTAYQCYVTALYLFHCHDHFRTDSGDSFYHSTRRAALNPPAFKTRKVDSKYRYLECAFAFHRH